MNWLIAAFILSVVLVIYSAVQMLKIVPNAYLWILIGMLLFAGVLVVTGVLL